MAQSNPDSVFAKHVIRTYPLNYFAGGEINLGYEQVINNKESFEIILAWNFKDWIFVPSGVDLNNGSSRSGVLRPLDLMDEGSFPAFIPSKGGSIRLNYRYYFTKNKPMPLGAYIGPQFMFKHTNFDDKYVADDYHSDSIKIMKNAVTLKFLLGYQSRISNRFSIDYYIGAGFRYQSQKAIRYYRIEWDEEVGDHIVDTERITNTSNLIIPTLHLGISVGCFF